MKSITLCLLVTIAMAAVLLSSGCKSNHFMPYFESQGPLRSSPMIESYPINPLRR